LKYTLQRNNTRLDNPSSLGNGYPDDAKG
jgi:hypothetical protein